MGENTDEHKRGKNFRIETEIEKLLYTAKRGRHGVRDHLLLIMINRQGLRVTE